MSNTYKIVRYYFRSEVPKEVVAEGLTLEEAQEHCNDPETSSKSCTSEEGRERTQKLGMWFDGYMEE